MAMSASCKIVNKTGDPIEFTKISKVNDNSTWSIEPPVGTHIPDGKSCLIAMGNSSFFPRGVGFEAKFVSKGNQGEGAVILNDPGVGSHEFSFRGNYAIGVENPSGNSYIVTVLSG